MKVYVVINMDGVAEFTFTNYEEALRYAKSTPDRKHFIFEVVYSIHFNHIRLLEA